jgi:hypothetical protein
MPPITNALPDLDRTLAFFPAEARNPKALTSAQIKEYNESGYISPIDIFTAKEAAANREEFDFLITAAQEVGHTGYSR